MSVSSAESIHKSDVTLEECSTFYFTNVVFQVEDTLFRVPRLYFEQESEVFRTMFQLPVASGSVPDGTSNSQPLRLEGVKKQDFRYLLRAMFPERPLLSGHIPVLQWLSVLKLTTLWQMDGLTKAVLNKLSASNASCKDWIALLDLSFHHHLPDARALAIHKLASTSTFASLVTNKIALARKYQIKAWLRDGLRELVQRQEPLSDVEGEDLGFRTTLKLYRVRHAYEPRRQYNTSEFAGFADAKIKEEFGSELAEMADEPNQFKVWLSQRYLENKK